MPIEQFIKALQDVKSPEHETLLQHVKGLVDISRGEMSKKYSTWDEQDAVFASDRPKDGADERAEAKGEPSKIIVPMNFSQVMTFVSFAMLSLTQNPRFFELQATGAEDNVLKEATELTLERDTKRNQWMTFLVQVFLDLGRFSLAAAEICYKEEYRYMRLMQETQEPGAFGAMETNVTATYTPVPVFIGNKVYPVSPYRILPDTRLPLTRYQEGEFCGSEDIFSYSSLVGDTSLFNLDKIPKLTEDGYRERRKVSKIPDMETRQNGNLGATMADDPHGYVSSGRVIITKMVMDIIPKNFEVRKETPLGKEAFPVRYISWVANDQTVIRFEEATYLHCQFPYVLAQFLPDQHHTINKGLAEMCDPITNLITWLINAHVASQRQSVQSRFIVDPSGVDVKTLKTNTPYIYTKKGAAQFGVDRYIKQLTTQDVTANVMQDVAQLKELLEVVSGFSGNMQGQYASGRRSATESRTVTQGSSARGKATVASVWETFFAPMGRQLIANNRQEMDAETFLRIVGTKPSAMVNPETLMPFTAEELFVLFKADPVTIATAEDFLVHDGSLPSEKAFLAQSLQEILTAILANPLVAQVYGLDPRALMNEIYTLRGVTNISMFQLPAPTGAQNVVPIGGAPQGAPVGPASGAPPSSVSNG